MKAIKLGTPMSKLASEPLAPPGGDMSYPSLHLEGPDLSQIPESGESIIKHKVKSRTIHSANGKKSHSLHLEVHSIRPYKKPKVATSTDDRDAMASLMQQ
jgi:hypothetical protein